MRPWSCNPADPGRLRSLVRFLSILLLVLSCHCCPDGCFCSPRSVKCQNLDLDGIPTSIPADTTSLSVTGNHISRIGETSFPARLDLLTNLSLGGNQLDHVEENVFANLPNLTRLDLSNNRIQSFSDRAFPMDSKLKFLNLSRSIYNHSFTDSVLDFLRRTPLLQLTFLDLSNNDLLFLPDAAFTGLPSLATLDLRSSSLIRIQNGTLPVSATVDLRDNNLTDLPHSTLAELSLRSGLHIWLAENPWRCSCFIDELLVWLNSTSQVMDAHNLTCERPEALRHRPLLQLDQSELKQCSSDAEIVLETSYVFLGLVLALIGVIFLLVLYLNKKGIKRWMYNIRDACRDHMEGYHYRYEISSDPRLANLSINSDV